MNEEELDALVLSRMRRVRRRGNASLRRWIRTFLWLNLNVSALLVLAVLALAYYHTSKSPVWHQSAWWAAPGGPARTLFFILILGIVEAVAWLGWFLLSRPGARLWAGVLGLVFLGKEFCIAVFVAMVWDMKVHAGHYIFLYVGLSHLLFAFFGDDGATYQFRGRRDRAKPKW